MKLSQKIIVASKAITTSAVSPRLEMSGNNPALSCTVEALAAVRYQLAVIEEMLGSLHRSGVRVAPLVEAINAVGEAQSELSNAECELVRGEAVREVRESVAAYRQRVTDLSAPPMSLAA